VRTSAPRERVVVTVRRGRRLVRRLALRIRHPGRRWIRIKLTAHRLGAAPATLDVRVSSRSAHLRATVVLTP